MAFIRHLPCPRCNSRDNYGEFDNGFYCFGCGYREAKEDLLSLRSRLEGNINNKKVGDMLETSSYLPSKPLKWLLSYGLSEKEIEQFGWNEDRSLLVLYQGNDYWQARNFNEDSPAKYLSQGKKPILFYEGGEVTESPTGQTVVMVEDIISAVKVSRWATTVPLLGSTMPQELILSLVGRFKNYYLWLDMDKAKQSLKQARNASQVLGKVVPIVTALDPKEHSDKTIEGILL